MKLPLKLAILVIVIFGLLVTGMVLWKPMKVQYYASKLQSEDLKVRQNATKKLLDLNSNNAFDHFNNRYGSSDIKERIKVVNELCATGEKGKALMIKVFIQRCRDEQIRIPAGTVPYGNSTIEMKSMYVNKYEVTKEKYFTLLKCTEFRHIRNINQGRNVLNEQENVNVLDHPVKDVHWINAYAYAKCIGMRLPTRWEWRYAASAGSTGRYCFGDNESLLGEYAWYKDNSGGKTQPVGRKNPNKWGLYDMHGNVWEWVITKNDVYAHWRMSLGGSCTSTAQRSSFHEYIQKRHGEPNPDFGFRCVRDVK